MKLLFSKRLLGTAALVLLLVLSMSGDALAQGRGRGRGRGLDNFDRKCGKFVNCHDASEGRWDGRGRRRNRVLSQRFFERSRRHHERRWENDNRHWRRHRNNRFRG